MSGGEAALAAAAIGSNMLGGIFAPEGQELSSFEGDPQVDPRRIASQFRQGLGQHLTTALAEAAAPVNVRTTVAPLPSFSGGGLPFDISAPAVDPNRMDASLRSIPGINFGNEADTTSGGFGPLAAPYQEPPAPYQPPPGPVDPSRPRNRRTFTEDTSETPATFETPEDVSTTQPVPDDLDQAEGAIELLLAQLEQAGGPRDRRMLS